MSKTKSSPSFFVATLFTGLITCISMLGCQHAGSKSEADAQAKGAAAAPKTAEANLTQVEAADRKKAIADVSYQLQISMDLKSETFAGHEKILFTWKGDSATFLDFDQLAKIETFSINGRRVAQPQFSNHRLTLPVESLKQGKNEVELTYVQHYSHDGRGLHRFQDPEDQRVYLYSQFESFDAHQMFACFDQPDIKATMNLSALAPEAWQVITTTRETTKTKSKDGMLWTFPQTPVMSTYLFSLHAGPYHKWESRAGNIPLRLFARESLAKYVITKDWFKPTQEGLKFYGDYFAYPYPFKKYDQIIAPDFNAGAMENIAAVTFTEHYVHRGAIAREDRNHLSSVILHEMAHMWFGDLVTMQWWDNLCLNESFATFMSALAMDQATEFKESWESFYREDKSWAYYEDQLVTTHPINGEVPDTESTFVNFDGITYGKGASVLKQLNFYLGDKNFRRGVRAYFKTYAYGNTKLQDFIGALEKSSAKDLSAWSTSWLRQAGLDTLTPNYSCEAGKITRFDLNLRGPEGKESSRSHRTVITLYKSSGQKLKAYRSIETEYKGQTTSVKDALGLACPDIVNPNDHDQDYVKLELDAKTLATAKDRLQEVDSTLARIVLWSTLHQMVRDAQLTPDAYLKILFTNYPNEKDLYTAESATERLEDVLHYLPDYGTPRSKEISKKIEEILWKRLQASAGGSDWQQSLFKTFAGNVQTSFGQDRLFDLLEGKTKLKGLTLDTDRRWELIQRLSALGDERSKSLTAMEQKQDTSERGIESAITSQAAWPSLEVKRKFFDESVQNPKLKYARQRAALRHILPHWQDSLRAELSSSYFEALPKLVQTRQEEFLGLFSDSFLPADCSEKSVAQITSFLVDHGEKMPSNVKKNLLVGRQEDERCVKARTEARKSL